MVEAGTYPCNKLTTQLMIDASLARFYWEESTDQSRWKEPEITQENASVICDKIERLQVLVKKFEREVWFNGLQKITNACKVRGMKGEYEGLTFMSWCCAGRCMMTLQKEDGDHITLITADDEKPYTRDRFHGSKRDPENMGPMGIQGIYATEEIATDLLNIVTANWQKFEIQPDTKVTIALPGMGEG